MQLSTEDRSLIQALAQQHRVSEGAVEALYTAVAHGQGRAAQFNHPELGGMGQWMAGGMVMVGDFANHQLKATVAQLCEAIAAHLRRAPADAAAPARAPAGRLDGAPAAWWPDDLGAPTAAGGQNSMHYAYFAQRQRLAIRRDDRVSVYDTGPHAITGVDQQQAGAQSLRLHSQQGEVALEALPRVQEYEL